MIKISFFVIISIILSIIDIRDHRAPDILTLGGCVAVLTISVSQGLQSFIASFISLFCGGAMLFLVRVVTNSGLGWGDIKFAALIGCTLELRDFFLALFIAAIFAILFAILNRSTKKEIAFIPFLTIGSILAFCISYFNPFGIYKGLI